MSAPDVIARINHDVSAIIDEDDVKKQWAKIGVEPEHDSPEDLQAIISNEVATFTQAARKANITAE